MTHTCSKDDCEALLRAIVARQGHLVDSNPPGACAEWKRLDDLHQMIEDCFEVKIIDF